ncbi:MAG: ribonuclease P protein component [Cyanobacteria bacterium J06607_13]
MALPRQNRLRSPRDFSRVYRRGKQAATRYLAVKALYEKALSNKPNHLDKADVKKTDRSDSGPRFGISISRKVSKRAVVRNRIKRQLKAVIHQHLPHIDPGWQVVIVVRPVSVECSFADFLRELEYLLKKLGIVTNANSLTQQTRPKPCLKKHVKKSRSELQLDPEVSHGR